MIKLSIPKTVLPISAKQCCLKSSTLFLIRQVLNRPSRYRECFVLCMSYRDFVLLRNKGASSFSLPSFLGNKVAVIHRHKGWNPPLVTSHAYWKKMLHSDCCFLSNGRLAHPYKWNSESPCNFIEETRRTSRGEGLSCIYLRARQENEFGFSRMRK